MGRGGTFTLEKITLTASGELTVYGTVTKRAGLSRLQRPGYEIGIHRLGGDGVHWIPATVTGSNFNGFSVTASLDASIEQRLADYTDFYFRRTGEAAQDAQKVHVPDEPDEDSGWTAYPTMYGNFSFRRGSV